MVQDIKMCRLDNSPWGFRLVGGSDFDYPLTVVKVSEDSNSEKCGLRAGDVILRINDTPAVTLTHEQANQIIRDSGNEFFFGIYREDAREESMPKYFTFNENERSITPFQHEIPSDCEYMNEEAPIVDEKQLQTGQNFINEGLNSNDAKTETVNEEVAEDESNSHSLQTSVGIFPKPKICMTSMVLQNLNEEVCNYKTKKLEQKEKWTTFLQKPNRPIPKTKEELEIERKALAAKNATIVESTACSTPSLADGLTLIPEPEVIIEQQTEPEIKEINDDLNIEENTPKDNELPDLEEKDFEIVAENEINIPEDCTNKTKSVERTEEHEQEAHREESNSIKTEQEENDVPIVMQKDVGAWEKNADEIDLELQLVDVKKELEALSSLPSTIQATLDAVTKQLSHLLPAFKLQQQQQRESEFLANLEATNAASLETTESETLNSNAAIEPEALEIMKDDATLEQEANSENELEAINDNVYEHQSMAMPAKVQDSVTIEQQKSTAQVQDPVIIERQKSTAKELEEHLARKYDMRVTKCASGPLTPSSERPLVLPGGRRWYRAKDAFNDEFIAETLSAQAELITGTTLGVNFMKYQKPKKTIDFNRSEVYKVIHSLDRQRLRGIEVRPPVVLAEADIRKSVSTQ